MSMGLCPTRATRAREPRYKMCITSITLLLFTKYLLPKFPILLIIVHYHNNSATGIRVIPNYSFPFQDLENDEFLKTIGSWVYISEGRLSGKVDLYRDIVVSPDKNDPFKCANDNYIKSHYYSVKTSGKIFNDACKQKEFSIFHCNIHSLEKKKKILAA